VDEQLQGRGGLGRLARTLMISIVLLVGSGVMTETALADQGTVRLNNGGVISGEIVVYVPGVRVSVRAADEQVYTFEAAEIASVDVQGTPPPEAPAPQPQPQGGVPIVEDDQQPQMGGAVPPPAPQAQPGPQGQPPGNYGGPAYAPQPGAMTRDPRAQLEAERQQLVRSMPGIGQQIAGMVLAGVITIVGSSFWAVSSRNFDSTSSSPFFGEGCSSAFGGSSCSWSTGMTVGIVFLVAGPVLLLVNTLVMIGKLRRRGNIRRRIREIDQQLQSVQTFGRIRWDLMTGPGRAGLRLGTQF